MFEVAIRHWFHDQSDPILIGVRANQLDEMPVRKGLECFQLVFETLDCLLVPSERLSSRYPLASKVIYAQPANNMIYLSKAASPQLSYRDEVVVCTAFDILMMLSFFLEVFCVRCEDKVLQIKELPPSFVALHRLW